MLALFTFSLKYYSSIKMQLLYTQDFGMINDFKCKFNSMWNTASKFKSQENILLYQKCKFLCCFRFFFFWDDCH